VPAPGAEPVSAWVERLDGPIWGRLRDPRTNGVVGILLGVLACFVAIPPITARSPVYPVLIGIAAAVLGLGAAMRGRRRLGWGAVAAGLIGIALGVLAGTFSERSGVVNIGLEGMMLMGAFWGVYGADKSSSWVIGLVIAMAAGGLLALVHAVFAIHLRADQIVGGTAVNFLALGITCYFFFQLYHGNDVPQGVPTIPDVKIPGIKGSHFFGPAFGDLNVMVWLSFALVIISWIVLFKTSIGLRIRACGEHPRAADTVGISVYGISIGFGGGAFTDNMTAGRGFIALAAMIFGNWRPFGAFGAALLFGFSTALAYRLPAYSSSAATLFQTLPYVLTLIAVAGVIGRTSPPAADGKPYQKQ
jgi:ABC-type uncharacterized transport system permease subunit